MHNIPESSKGSDLFPEFEDLFELIKLEVAGLSDRQLDYTSTRWTWSEWSIRNQLSHMASLIPRWLVVRWGNELFPQGNHGIPDLDSITNSPSDRRLDDQIYWQKNKILCSLNQYLVLACDVLKERNVGYLRSRIVNRGATPQWKSMSRAHHTGITAEGDPASGTMTLEATFRHIYFEEVTHLYNIQRLKKAQGLRPSVNVPKVGYWMLDDWDRSEP